MEKEKILKVEEQEVTDSGLSRRSFCKVVAGVSVVSSVSSVALAVSDEAVPAEPENLDEPTPWQEGDPEPVEQEVPAEEPEQTSTEAPPAQPMEDVQPEQPSDEHVWVSGYWWWHNRRYMWVPGYWSLPPRKRYAYVPGYWRYRGSRWVYVRGGWAKPNTAAILLYPAPRPLLRTFVFFAPRRIVRRHRRWRHFPARRAHRRVARRVKRRLKRKAERRRRRR